MTLESKIYGSSASILWVIRVRKLTKSIVYIPRTAASTQITAALAHHQGKTCGWEFRNPAAFAWESNRAGVGPCCDSGSGLTPTLSRSQGNDSWSSKYC